MGNIRNSPLKSVHFKNTVTRSSFHSKLWPFSIIHQLILFWCQLMYDRRSWFLASYKPIVSVTILYLKCITRLIQISILFHLSVHSLIWFQVSIYHSLSVLSYFICVCISFGGFSPAAIPSYVLFPLVIGDLICACIKLRKTPEVMKAEAEMKAEMKAESNWKLMCIWKLNMM